jgi:DNA-binding winged helix-turn-helix (wHTH) protein/Tfp pilus assembly protein PilF
MGSFMAAKMGGPSGAVNLRPSYLEEEGPVVDRKRVRFGLFEIDAEAGELRRQGVRVPLQELPFRLLCALVERPGEIVLREELRRRLWPPDVHLDFENSLNAAMSRLRDALGDAAANPRFVATAPRRGWRFIAPVETLAVSAPAPAITPPLPAAAPRPFRAALLLAALGASALAAPLVLWRSPLGPHPTSAESVVGSLPPSHEDYLRGRHLLSLQTREGDRKALAAFQAAAVEDPAHAGTQRGLAEAYLALSEHDVWPAREALPRAAQAARQALGLEPRSADAGLVLAQVRFHLERDWPAAEATLRQVLASNPGLVRARVLHAHFLSASGRHDRALAEIEEARRLDPLSLAVNADVCWIRFMARRYQQAVEQCQATLELDPHFLPAQDNLKWILMRMGRSDAAAQAFLRVVALEGEDAGSVLALRERYSREGLAGLHRASLGGLMARARHGYQSPYDIALEYASLREPREALAWLERSFEANETDLALLGVDPRLDALRQESRFRQLVARVGAPAAGGRWMNGGD